MECTCCRCKDVWTEGIENTCEGSCEDCACEKCSCEECTCDGESCDPWEETICGSGMECTCEECCAPNNETSEEYDYYFPIDNSGSTQEPEVVEDDTGECIEGDEYDNYEDTDDDYVYDPAEDGNEIEIVDDRHYDTPIVRLVDYTRYMQIGDEFTFTAREAMSTQNRRIVWSSSDPAIIEIEENTGIATAHKEGTAIILATTYDFEIEEFCEVVVDKRELVTVTRVIDEKDEYFTVTFKDGKVWKSVGCDMEDSENRSSDDLYGPSERYLYQHELNHRKNIGKDFSYQQLALLYRMDPYGVTFYTKEYSKHHYREMENRLIYVDNVYKSIFDVNEDYFYFRPDGAGGILRGPQMNPYKYLKYDRIEVYSDAEMLFGGHTIADWDWGEAAKLFVKLTIGVMAILRPDGVFSFLDCLISVTDFVQLIFLSSSIEEKAYSATYGLTTDRSEDWAKELKEQGKTYANINSGRIASVVADCIIGLTNCIHPLSMIEQDICRVTSKNRYYKVIIEIEDGQVAIDDFVLGEN